EFVSVQTVPKNHRQNTAACVSLSNSTMSKTKPASAGPANHSVGGEERRI
ncbi:MAG: hypothetical protein ACI9LT_001333, partial [Pseudoalteromonas distincta]